MPPCHPGRAPAAELLRINRDAYELSAATGGDFYFWAPGEFASSGVRIPLGQDAVLLSYGELAGGMRRFCFPVDTVVPRLALFLGAQGKDRFRILRPGGIEMAHGGGTDLQEFRHMTIASVDAPEPGEWCLVAEGKGLHAFSARVAAAPPGKGGERPVPISVVRADFIDPKGYLGREGYMPKKVKPRAGKTMQFSVRMNGPFDTVSFELVAPDGTVLIRPNPIAERESQGEPRRFPEAGPRKGGNGAGGRFCGTESAFVTMGAGGRTWTGLIQAGNRRAREASAFYLSPLPFSASPHFLSLFG